MNVELRNAAILEFAMKAHDGQVRKYDGLPYITHPIAVAELVRGAGGDPNMQAAALLHDVLEDTAVTHAQLRTFLYQTCFQSDADDILNLVVELTDVYTKDAFPDLNRRDRKALEASRLYFVSRRAKNIKILDIQHNSDSILKHDPKFAKVFLAEKDVLMQKLF